MSADKVRDALNELEAQLEVLVTPAFKRAIRRMVRDSAMFGRVDLRDYIFPTPADWTDGTQPPSKEEP